VTDVSSDQLVEVELRGVPLDVAARAEEHSDGVMREFSLISGGGPGDAVPARLLRLADRLQEQYGSYGAISEQEMEKARQRGDRTVDMTVPVPASAREAAIELGTMLAEADEYCRRGDLLSLVPPEDVLQFRAWYLEQFIDQIDGKAPVSWDDYRRPEQASR
jgi:hypothetical protein